MAIIIVEERPDSPTAIQLIDELESTLASHYPAESRHGYSVEQLLQEAITFFVLRYDDMPAGCGGVQLFGHEYAELKRIYVRLRYRGLGLGRLLADHLAQHSVQCGTKIIRLETGIYQEAAIRLYEQMGFQRIAPFGDYEDDPLSIFFEKRLS
jgi:ribosomal protein S18 acetylase RimI-like enzyme